MPTGGRGILCRSPWPSIRGVTPSFLGPVEGILFVVIGEGLAQRIGDDCRHCARSTATPRRAFPIIAANSRPLASLLSLRRSRRHRANPAFCGILIRRNRPVTIGPYRPCRRPLPPQLGVPSVPMSQASRPCRPCRRNHRSLSPLPPSPPSPGIGVEFRRSRRRRVHPVSASPPLPRRCR